MWGNLLKSGVCPGNGLTTREIPPVRLSKSLLPGGSPVALCGSRSYINGSKFPAYSRSNLTVPRITMARQFVYFMQGLSKAYPTRKVLDNVHLSFYPDAKIGVLGVNGSGKSTLPT